MKKYNERQKASPRIINGEIAIDDRGEVAFVNDLDMRGVKRFYTIANHRARFVRAWHAHKKEGKYVTVIDGAAVIACVRIDNWHSPSRDLKIDRYVLSGKKPAILFIPGGYANGFMTLKRDTKLLFFSTASVSESREDDFRYDARYWDPWKIIER